MVEDLSSIVGKNLASLRKTKGLTQQQLANMLHYSDKSISKWELGYAIPSVDILKEFADFYGVTIDSLLVPMDQEKVDEVIKAELKEESKNWLNMNLIIALTDIVIFGIAVVIVIAALLMDYEPAPYYTLVWAVPVCCLVSAGLCHRFYGNIAETIVLSAFFWTLLLAFAIHWQFFMDPPQSIWYVLLIGLPLQAIVILSAVMRHNKIKK